MRQLKTPPLILASTSKYRRAQMRAFGLRFRATPPLVDEDSLKRQNPRLRPVALARLLALKKAQSLLPDHPDAIIIGADQLIHFKGRVLGKPGSSEKAKKMLRALSGETHQLITSVCVLAKGRRLRSVVVANITLRKLTKHEIEQYIALDSPLDCAGSYKLEKAGLSLVEKLRVSDPSSLTGLPMMKLHQLLLQTGAPIPFKRRP